jgi:hypothetical protein
MLEIKETKWSGQIIEWTASNENDFCITLMRCYPRGDWSVDWSFEQFKQWLADGLKALDIVKV